jgi:hypothetical protein
MLYKSTFKTVTPLERIIVFFFSALSAEKKKPFLCALSVFAVNYYIFSNTVAIPWPPPIHSEARPRL